ncbi:MAG: endonuclease domain-containing protein [Solirubrobacteraceae bacterium]
MIPVLPRVYAVGHLAPSVDADLTSALLYAGPGAMLDAATAAWWIGAIRHRPQRLVVATPRRCRSLEPRAAEPFRLRSFIAVDVRGRRPYPRIWLPRDGRVYGPDRRIARRLPIPPLPQLMLTIATKLEHNPLRKALAQVEFRRLVDLETLKRACGPGRPGSRALLHAVARHQPRLAKTKSDWEDMLLFICEDGDLPIPEINEWIGGVQADATWYAHKLVVEIDGGGNHGTDGQMKSDRSKDFFLRELGYLVIRYSVDMLRDDPERVATDIRRHLAEREHIAQASSQRVAYG